MVRKGITLKAEASIFTPLLPLLRGKDAEVKAVALSSGASFVSVLDALCEQDDCVATVQLNDRFQPTVWDIGHLTEAGSLHLARRIMQSVITNSRR